MHLRICALSEDSDRAVWSESSLGAFRIAKGATFLQSDNEDSDQTTQKVRFLTFGSYAILEDLSQRARNVETTSNQR